MAHNSLHFPILKDLGLGENEALIFELLLEMGPKKASELVEPSGIGRGNVYNVLIQLQQKGLVTVRQGKQQVYEAVDPARLRALLEQRMQEAERLKSAFETSLPQLTSTFNLSTGKPAVQIFEGIEGVKQALYESLASTTEILTYFDVNALVGPMAEINRGYVKKRIEKKILKRLIVADTRVAREFFEAQNTPYTKVAFVKDFPERHASAMEIYDGTISYITLTPEKTIAVLVKDASIYELHKQQFEAFWRSATTVIDYAASRTDDRDARGSKTT